MENTTYNGWYNYATWRINLEFDFSNYAYNMGLTKDDISIDTLPSELQYYVEESLELDCNNETTLSYAMAFIDEVNWYEIATHIIENIEE